MRSPDRGYGPFGCAQGKLCGPSVRHKVAPYERVRAHRFREAVGHTRETMQCMAMAAIIPDCTLAGMRPVARQPSENRVSDGIGIVARRIDHHVGGREGWRQALPLRAIERLRPCWRAP